MARRFADRSALTFRPIRADDEAFLSQLYASTREDVQSLDWDEARKAAFLRMQYLAQHRYYQQQFTKAAFDLILHHDQPIGRLYVDRRDDEIRIIDIALLPAYRNTGIGTTVLKELLAEATQVGKPVRLHVERYNPALRLYQRLGFVKIGETGVYDLMQWSPGGAA